MTCILRKTKNNPNFISNRFSVKFVFFHYVFMKIFDRGYFFDSLFFLFVVVSFLISVIIFYSFSLHFLTIFFFISIFFKINLHNSLYSSMHQFHFYSQKPFIQNLSNQTIPFFFLFQRANGGVVGVNLYDSRLFDNFKNKKKCRAWIH
jgi:hypothetical protein